jgi:hypothetical protein
MAALSFQRYLVECDGCQNRHGEPDGRRTSEEARAAAYADGWRFPAMVKSDGKPGASTSDVCPKCVPNWTPVRWGVRRGRALKQSEAPSTGLDVPTPPAPQSWPEKQFDV